MSLRSRAGDRARAGTHEHVRLVPMNGGASSFARRENEVRMGRFLICSIVAINLVLTVLTWSRWFTGTEQQIGFGDRVFGTYRLGGFRADCVWLSFSTAALIVVLFHSLSKAKRSRSARVSALLSVLGIFAFGVYVYRVLTAGLLYMG